MKITTCPINEKQSQTLELLKYGTVMAFVDSRHAGVVVPEYLKGDYQLRLNFDYAFEINDFRVLPDRIEASLSFNHKNFFCVVPFDAVYLLLSHGTQRGSLFIESVPSEMLSMFTMAEVPVEAKVSAPMRSTPPAPATTEAQPVNTITNTARTEAPKPTTTPDQDNKSAKKKSHLRLVK